MEKESCFHQVPVLSLVGLVYLQSWFEFVLFRNNNRVVVAGTILTNSSRGTEMCCPLQESS